MTDLLYHNARGLERPQEHVIDGFGLKVLRLNILVRLVSSSTSE
jgi:hypothetical protein